MPKEATMMAEAEILSILKELNCKYGLLSKSLKR